MSATIEADRSLSPADVALAYHTRTKHKLERFAAGPDTLDWDAQPNAFREFAGAPRMALPLVADQITTRFGDLSAGNGVPPASLTVTSVSALLELSFGLSAWKEYGPDRWALRCNPSSGNLHPTEVYLFASGVSGIDDGIHHYLSREHALELRAKCSASAETPPRIWIGLSSVHWREAWKYGERAFRYCQLDIGHALGAVCYAARALGWSATVIEGVETSELAKLMGLDRAEDFAGVEREDADLLIAITPGPAPTHAESLPDEFMAGDWSGRANLLDAHPMYRWPVIDQVSEATHGGSSASASEAGVELSELPPLQQNCDARASEIILGRRSAQRFNAKSSMDVDTFHQLLDSLLVRPTAPWNAWSFAPRLHPIFFVHRVEGLEPGVYAMPRHAAAIDALRKGLRDDFEWKTPNGTPAHLPFFRLLPANTKAIAKTVSCHQAIASDGCFALSMISEFEPTVAENPWRYRQLHWEAGLLGQVLYLEAEAAGLRGTGIGCYFDDGLHSLLGITSTQFQALYHFTVGDPISDARIMTLPAYPGRQG